MRHWWQIGALVLAAGTQMSCSAMFGPKTKQQEIKGFGQISVPSTLEPASPFVRSAYATIEFNRYFSFPENFFWMGGTTPVREVLAITISRTEAKPDRPAVFLAGKHCDDEKWLAQSGPVRVGECVYKVNTHERKAWIVAVDDPARRVSMAYRAFQKDVSRERAVEILTTAFTSYKPLADQEAPFRAVDDEERKENEEGLRREAAVLAWIAAKGWPRPELQKTVVVGDIAYVRWHRMQPEIDFACLVGSTPRGAEPKLDPRFNSGVLQQFQGEWKYHGMEDWYNYTPMDAFKDRVFVAGRQYHFYRTSADAEYLDEFVAACEAAKKALLAGPVTAAP